MPPKHRMTRCPKRKFSLQLRSCRWRRWDHYTLLKDVLCHPRRKDVGQALKLHHGAFSKRRFGSHHPSSDVRNRGLDHLRADGTARGPDRQPTPDGGSPGQRSVVSFCLCRPTEAYHPFHSKRMEPFSRHQGPITFFGKYCDFH